MAGLLGAGVLSFEPLLVLLERQSHGEPDAWTHFLSSSLAVAGIASFFFIHIAYSAVFEAVTQGQTPGKRLLGMRVTDLGGFPVRPREAILRNLARLLDFLPMFYGVGLTVAFFSSKVQRLGDLLAGTLVVRERASPLPESPRGARPLAHAVAALSPEEERLVRDFLERRHEFLPAARARLARQLASGLGRRHGGPEEDVPAEEYLERLVGHAEES